MKNSQYWKLRFAQLEEAQNNRAKIAFSEIEQQYKQAQKHLEEQIAVWYQRLADNNGITLAEARQFLKTSDLKEFRWDVEEYIKYGKENALNQQWVKQLENASAKFHISKLEAIKIHTRQSLEVMFQKQYVTRLSAYQNTCSDSYYHTAYELQKGFNIGWEIAGLNQSQIEKIISKPWSADGYNFSERIWYNKNKLINEVHTVLTQSMLTGFNPQKAIDTLAKKMKTSKNRAGAIIMTESAFFSSLSEKECYDNLGVEQYEILATLDSRTSEICQNLDGKVFDMNDFQPGVTAPPFHVNCRSTTVPYFSENFGQIGERAARDPETGETYYVPDDMTYKDWKKSFVDGDKSGLETVDNSDKSGIIKLRSSGSGDKQNNHYYELIGNIDVNNNKVVAKAIKDFEIENKNSKIEKCLVITQSGENYVVYGDKWTVNTGLLGDKMKGSINEHNHVTGKSQYSFSYEDLLSSVQDGSKIAMAFDEKYRYIMKLSDERVSEDKLYETYKQAKDEVNEDLFCNPDKIPIGDEQHERIKRTCEKLGIKYERIKASD